MNPVPVIIPVENNESSISSSARSCLEMSENADLYKKYLNSENLTDEDTERLTTCINEKNKAFGDFSAKFLVWSIVIVVFVIILVWIFA